MTVARKRGRAHGLKRRRPDRGQLGFQCIGCRRIERRCRRPLIVAAEYKAAVFVNGVGVQGLVLPAYAAGAALQLAAGGFRQRAGIEQQRHRQRFAAGFAHRHVERRDQPVHRDQFLQAAGNFRGQANALTIRPLNAEGGHAALAHRVHLALYRALDILGIQIVAAHDDQILDPAGDIELARVHKAQIAGSQPAGAGLLDERPCAFFRFVPVTLSHARAAKADFTQAALGARRQRVGLANTEAMPGHHATAGHQGFARRIERGLTALQAIALKNAGEHAGARPAVRDHQGRLGQAVAGIHGRRGQSRAGKTLGEGFKGVVPDRLGTAKGDPPARQVQPLELCVFNAFGTKPKGEIRPAADGAAMAGHGLQPARRAFEKKRRRQQHRLDTAVDGLQQAADEAHVVKQGQPGNENVVFRDGHGPLDRPFIGHQVAVRHHHALGRRGGAGGVLQQSDVFGGGRLRLPAIGAGRIDAIDRDHAGHRVGAAQLAERVAGQRDHLAAAQHARGPAVPGHRLQAPGMLIARGLRRKRRHRDQPGIQAGEKRHHVVLAVVEQQQRPVLWIAVLLQHSRQSAHAGIQLPVAERGIERPAVALGGHDQRGILRPRGGEMAQVIDKIVRGAIARHIISGNVIAGNVIARHAAAGHATAGNVRRPAWRIGLRCFLCCSLRFCLRCSLRRSLCCGFGLHAAHSPGKPCGLPCASAMATTTLRLPLKGLRPCATSMLSSISTSPACQVKSTV